MYTYSIYFNENSRWKATFQKRSLEWKYRGVRIHRLESHFLIDLFRRSIWIFLEQAYMVQQLNRILESKENRQVYKINWLIAPLHWKLTFENYPIKADMCRRGLS